MEKSFFYKVFDDFLTNQQFNEILTAYNSLKFKESYSDLFNFMVSAELNEDERFENFKARLNEIFSSKIQQEDKNLNKDDTCHIQIKNKNINEEPFYTFSASYYRKNDFLYCHDDMVDQRLYAIVFYLEDLDTGKLMLYEKDCLTLHKAIDVKANRLVIFRVGPTSFHEVQRCATGGRKALSGWINKVGVENRAVPYEGRLSVHSSVIPFDLNLDLKSENFYSFEFEDIKNGVKGKLVGPLINRRVYEIESSEIYVPQFAGYELIHTEYLEFDQDCYILCNDIINEESCALDVFIFDIPGDKQIVEKFIKYFDDSNKVVFEVDAVNDFMFVGKRANNRICIHKVEGNVRMKHFMYIKSG